MTIKEWGLSKKKEEEEKKKKMQALQPIQLMEKPKFCGDSSL